MQNKKANLWYAVYDLEKPYAGPEPYFWNKADFPWIEQAEDNWSDIEAELQRITSKGLSSFETYKNEERQSEAGKWKTTGFYFWSRPHTTNLKQYPQIAEWLNSIPHLVGATLNLLEPQGRVEPHCGETNGNIRIQFGVVIPEPLPVCGFKVGNEDRGWEEGKALLFTDAHRHTAWNHSDQRRFLLILDIIRPEFVHKKYSICCSVMAMQTMEMIASKLGRGFPKKTNMGVLLSFYTLRFLWFLYMPIHRKLGEFLYR